jgi:hypothetical protein
MSNNMKARALINARQRHIHVSARSLEDVVGPVGVIRDTGNLEIQPPSGKVILTKALQVRPRLKPNALRPTCFVHALRI